MSVLKRFQPPLVQIKIRRHITKVCSLWPWILFYIQNSRRSISLFWFPIFLYIRFVFHFNEQQSDLFKGSCQVASLALVWPPSGATCFSSNFGHQMAPLALPHCLGLPYWHHQLVLSCYPHQPESHQLSLQNSLGVTSGYQGHLGPIKMQKTCCWCLLRSSLESKNPSWYENLFL